MAHVRNLWATMPANPSPQLFTLFVRAAKQHGISHSFLLAVADVESGLDAAKISDGHYAGAASEFTRRGLFQLSDQQLAELQLDAGDAEAQINAVADMLAQLKAFADDDPLWDEFAGALYFAKLGRGEFSSSIAAGAQRLAANTDGPNADHWPDPPQAFVKAVRASRRYYQDAGQPEGSKPFDKLKNAANRMRELYPGLQPMLAKLVEDLSEYGAAQASQILDSDPGLLHLHDLWFDYARFFDAAPYTDSTTPAPWRIEPNVADKLKVPAFEGAKEVFADAKKAAGELVDKGSELAEKAGEKLDTYILVGLGIAGALGALWIVVNRRNPQ